MEPQSSADAASGARVRFFSPGLERLNLGFPLIFFALLAWEFFSGYRFSTQERVYGNFVAKILLLNHVHVYFSFALLILAPEIRQWAIEKNKTERLFFARWLAVFVSVFALNAWGLSYLKLHAVDSRFYDGLISLIAIVGLHHNYSQTLGLSLGYNRRAQDMKLERPSYMNRFESAERFFVRAMMGLQFTRMLWLVIDPKAALIGNTLAGLVFVCAGILVAMALAHPTPYRHKTVFMFRYVFFAFMPFSFIALLAMLANHGVEYFCVFRQMQERSIQRNSLNRRAVLAATVLFVGTLTVVAIFGRSQAGYWITPLLPDNQTLALYLGAFALAGSFLHYHIDSFMFRMKDRKTQEAVGSLLFFDVTESAQPARQPTSLSFEESNRLKRVAP